MTLEERVAKIREAGKDSVRITTLINIIEFVKPLDMLKEVELAAVETQVEVMKIRDRVSKMAVSLLTKL